MPTTRAAIFSTGQPWMPGRLIMLRMRGVIPSAPLPNATSAPGRYVPERLTCRTFRTAFTSIQGCTRGFQIVSEVEKRYTLFGQTGRVLVTGFDSRGRMALLDGTIGLARSTGVNINTALVDARQYRSRLGGVLGLEQPITETVGIFARVSKSAGNVEPYEFTYIDRSVSIRPGTFDQRDSRWHRPDDTVGLAVIDNGIFG